MSARKVGTFSWGSALRSLAISTVLAAMAITAHCGVGKAGDRCNPNQQSDECNGGLSCTTNSCGISVCCPPVLDANSPPDCRPVQPDCAVDGGAAGSGGAGGEAGAGGGGGAGGDAAGSGGAAGAGGS